MLSPTSSEEIAREQRPTDATPRASDGCAEYRCAPVRRMATIPITVSIPHQLGRAEARRRIEDGFSKIVHLLPGSAGSQSEHWVGDSWNFRVAAMGQTAAGVIDVLDAEVRMKIELPGVLGIIAGGLKNRLQKAGQLLLAKN